MRYSRSGMEEAIVSFRQRIKEEPEFCKELFDYATVRLLALKYAYYIRNVELVKDVSYDYSEKDWYTMGRALDILKEDDISPCVDFDYAHPKAQEGIRLANKLLKKENI